MKYLDWVALLFYLISLVIAKEIKCPLPCANKNIYNPVCGMESNKHGHWTKEMFYNKCLMRNKNKCGGGKYIPCDSDLEPEEI